jgi:hypothetical protein
MSQPAQLDELHQLIEALLNGTLSIEQGEHLQDILQSAPEYRQAYMQYIDLHTNIYSLTQDEQQLVTLARNLEQDSVRIKAEPRTNSYSILWKSLAALLFIGCCGYFTSELITPKVISRSLPSQIVETKQSFPKDVETQNAVPAIPVILTQNDRGVLSDENLPTLGTALVLTHEYSLVQGKIEIQFPKGATAIIEAPAVFEINHADKMTVNYGNCSVHAPDGAEGFEVVTPMVNTVDLGTRFNVNVSEGGVSEVHVVEGAAEIQPLKELITPTTQPESAAILKAGESVRFQQQNNNISESKGFVPKPYQTSLRDRVLSYDAVKNKDGLANELKSIKVQRGGRAFNYDAQEIIGSDIVTFCEVPNNKHPVMLVSDEMLAHKADPLVMSTISKHDLSLCTGIVNPGGEQAPLTSNPVLPGEGIKREEITEGMTIRFRRPVINSVGPDLVVFDVQHVLNPVQGDAFHLSPLKFREGLRTVTKYDFDIAFNSPEALKIVKLNMLSSKEQSRTLDELLATPLYFSSHPLYFKALAVAIDLSEMGYAEGEEVSELFLQDVGDNTNTIDPVFIGGFPPVRSNTKSVEN